MTEATHQHIPTGIEAVRSPLFGSGLALIGYSVFSLHDALIKSVHGVPVFQTVFFAVLFSFVPFSIYLAVSRPERSFRPRLPGLLALRCVFMTMGLVAAFHAFSSAPMAEVYSLLFTAPILITLLAIPVLGERVRAFRWFAILMGLCGVLVVLRPNELQLSAGHLSAGFAALSISISAVVTRRIGPREHGITLILYPMLVTVLVSGIATAFVYEPMPASMLWRIASLGVLTVIGQGFVLWAYRTSEAQFVAPMQYSQMLWALLYGALVFNEPINTQVVAGAGVIVLSGLLFIWRELTASLTRPVLRTRNLRAASGPSAQSGDTDAPDLTLYQHTTPDEGGGTNASEPRDD